MKSVINYKKYTFNNYYIRNCFNLLTILHKVYFLFKNYERRVIMKKKIITLLLAIFITISSIVPAVAMEQTTSDKISNEKTSVNNVGNKENKILPNGEKGIKSKEEKDSNKLEKETKQKSNEKNSKEKEFNLLKEAKNVQMRPVKTHDDVIKKITVKSESGGPLGTVVQWQTVKVDMDFELPDHEVKKDDTTTIKLPDELVFVSTPAEFDVKDSQGNIVAKAKVDANKKTVTLTYTNYPETHSGVKGSLFFYSRIDHVKFKEKKKIDLNFKIGNKHISGGSIDWDGQGKPNGDYLQKASWKSSINGNVISYAVFINRKGQEIKKGWLEDTLDGEKVEYLKNEFRVVKGNWQWSGDQGDYELKNEVDITNKVKVEWHPNGKSFKLNFGDLSATEGITVYYKVKIGYTPIDGEVFKNKVKLTGEKIQERDAHNDYRYFTAGGKAEGYVYSIKIKKEGEKGESLAGAKFKLIRDRNNAVVGEYVTNEQGEIEIKDLLKDDYTLVETQAPKGYKLDNKEIKIKSDDFGTNKVAFKTITNKKERISIPVEKVWKGKALEKVEVTLKADGVVKEQVELSKTNNWKHTFENLDKYKDDGTLINYTIEEKAVPGYKTEIVQKDSNDITKGFVITNKETPKWTPMIPPTRNVKITKEWLGTDGSKITAPVDKIEVELYRDGKATGQKLELNKANNWTGEFKDLKAYESILNSKPYEYTIKEVGESNNSIKFDGKWFKVIYSGNMKDGIKVENKETPKWTPMIPPTRNVKITKEWLGTDGSKITAPVDKIEVELYRDGKATGQKLELNKANNWTGEFKDLKAYESILNSKPYEYTIKEVGESNNSIKFDGKWFKVIYSGTMKDGIKVTNTLIPTTPPPMPPKKPKLPKTGIGINTLIYAGISAISGGIILFLRKRKVKNEIDV